MSATAEEHEVEVVTGEVVEPGGEEAEDGTWLVGYLVGLLSRGARRDELDLSMELDSTPSSLRVTIEGRSYRLTVEPEPA